MMTSLLLVAGIPVMEFYGDDAKEACAYFATAVEATYHAATACALLIGA
jgi:hypothetical protein